VQRVFQDFVEGIRESQDANALRSATSKALAALDFHCFAYFVLSKRDIDGRDVISTYPQAWLERYAEQKYEWIDPVIQGVRTFDAPFEWDRAPADPSPAQRQLFDEAAEFGISCGFVIPFRDFGRPIAAMAIAGGEPAVTFRQSIQSNHRTLLLMAVFIHLNARRILSAGRGVAGVRLSHRELQCLHWAARGKSAWEIGCILGIARRTVSFHMDNAKAKLGVRTICQAVARLAADGL
jgi:LuxR family transcriptional regulator, activator of conjugal transfer of Ti plasmids